MKKSRFNNESDVAINASGAVPYCADEIFPEALWFWVSPQKTVICINDGGQNVTREFNTADVKLSGYPAKGIENASD